MKFKQYVLYIVECACCISIESLCEPEDVRCNLFCLMFGVKLSYSTLPWENADSYIYRRRQHQRTTTTHDSPMYKQYDALNIYVLNIYTLNKHQLVSAGKSILVLFFALNQMSQSYNNTLITKTLYTSFIYVILYRKCKYKE